MSVVSTDLPLPHRDAAENGSSTAAEALSSTMRVVPLGSHRGGGGGKRNMSLCFLSLRNGGTYTAIFPNQKLLDKGWEKVVAEAIFDGDTLTMYRIRKANSGENGQVLRSRNKERPRYEISNEEIGAVMASNGARHPVEDPTFDDDHCCIRVPSGWKVKHS
jgi:hypothetical protein